ncbi:CHD5-like protein [Forsythia ovata]|uniref:CHD5-like protein n=1 Tax=Forsythia ovata TaxID=205694 RepID=A0ABD1PWG4_9LAMI
MEETLVERGKSSAAPIIFILVAAFHFLSRYIELNKKKKGSMNATNVQLRAEIKQLLKEASTLSQPSTFAQAAKLRRMAAAKEKELVKNQEMQKTDVKSSYDMQEKILKISNIFAYVVLIIWFWRMPVATISEELVQPFGKMLSWRAGGALKDHVMVGIIPWLIVSARVNRFICRKVLK